MFFWRFPRVNVSFGFFDTKFWNPFTSTPTYSKNWLSSVSQFPTKTCNKCSLVWVFLGGSFIMLSVFYSFRDTAVSYLWWVNYSRTGWMLNQRLSMGRHGATFPEHCVYPYHSHTVYFPLPSCMCMCACVIFYRK